MCIICIELEKGSLLWHEARRNLREMKATISEGHLTEVEHKITKAELEDVMVNLTSDEIVRFLKTTCPDYQNLVVTPDERDPYAVNISFELITYSIVD